MLILHIKLHNVEGELGLWTY